MTDPTMTYSEWRTRIEERFASMAPVPDSRKRHLSPSGRYELEVCEYTAGETTWNYSQGTVRRSEDASQVANIRRNYGLFWFAWVVNDSEESLLCGEDYQGYNVINLSTGVNVLTFPREAFDGGGYCWAAAHPSPDGTVVAVEGCYWACPYSLTLYDFSDPARSPLPQLARYEDLDQVEGWVSRGNFAFTVDEGEEHMKLVWQRDEA